ncbi:unnamed protein product [Rangifer tarandus platyrhynchus]|uniref:Secreted protein n=1 Tax=Rangifer tarandus platyrhynchus TaxID=3082113 RepID=A0ABN8ZYF9_RANTA|nr:unnamed protein product [Rangifer tarandus platyrhynchus]
MPAVLLKAQSLSPVRLFATPWTVAHQPPLSTGFSSPPTAVSLFCDTPSVTRFPGRASPHCLKRVAQRLVLWSPRSGRLTMFHVLPVLLSPYKPLKGECRNLDRWAVRCFPRSCLCWEAVPGGLCA